MQCSHHDENQDLATHVRKIKGKRRGFRKTFKGRKSTPTFEQKRRTCQRFSASDVTSMATM
jgi:hypothetical protein